MPAMGGPSGGRERPALRLFVLMQQGEEKGPVAVQKNANGRVLSVRPFFGGRAVAAAAISNKRRVQKADRADLRIVLKY